MSTTTWVSMSQDERYKPPSFRRVDDQIVEESDMQVYEFITSDLSNTDPDVSANINIKAWLKTDPGQWILEHSVEKPYIVCFENIRYGGYTFRMIVRLRKQDQTFFEMKFK